MKTILTAHLRIKAPGNKLQQLVVFADEDAFFLSKCDLAHTDADVFRDTPGHSVAKWLELEVTHEWRDVPIVEDKPDYFEGL